MGVFRQLGDPVCSPCLCQHHGAAYAHRAGAPLSIEPFLEYEDIADGDIIISSSITITERCCIVVNAALVTSGDDYNPIIELERPHGVTKTNHRSRVVNNDGLLSHTVAWETLDPGTYEYHLVNRTGHTEPVWMVVIKTIASDCEG